MPPRVLMETLPTGVVQGIGLTPTDLDLMIQGYYRARGWTAEGLIPALKLDELEVLDSAPMGGTSPLSGAVPHYPAP